MSKTPPEAPEEIENVSFSMLGNVGPAMIVVVLGLIAAFTVPQLSFARPWKSGDPVPFWNVIGRPFEAEKSEAAVEREEKLEAVTEDVLAQDDPEPVIDRPEEVVEVEADETVPEYAPQPGDDKPPVQEIEQFKGNELDGFFASLARTDANIEGSVTRIIHWGDSAIGVDGITGAIRRRMQNRFGDAGHGFHLMAQPNSSYRHREVDFEDNGKWSKCFIIFKCRSDGHYGLGGTTFESGGGAQTTFAPDAKKSSGKVSKFEIWYAAHPKGGNIRYRVDRGEKILIPTKADALEDRWKTIEVEEGMHELEVRAGGEGRVRLYGVTIERDGPGVVWDGLAQIGAFTNRMLGLDPVHLKAQLSKRKPALAVLMFGGNDMIRRMTNAQYKEEYTEVLKLVRQARPEMACMLMTPLDHGERKGARIISKPIVARIVQIQREVAEEQGCAFFDTVGAMGGEGAAARWHNRKPRLLGSDLGHATPKGHQVIGELFYRALLSAYVDYRKRTDGTENAPLAKVEEDPDPEDAQESASDDEAPADDAAAPTDAAAPADAPAPTEPATPTEPGRAKIGLGMPKGPAPVPFVPPPPGPAPDRTTSKPKSPTSRADTPPPKLRGAPPGPDRAARERPQPQAPPTAPQ